MMHAVWLLLGSNMGNSNDLLDKAIGLIGQKVGVVKRVSKRYTTAAWGNTQQPDFLNQVICVQSAMPATQILKSILAIEAKMGRVRTVKNAPRTIDIDILFFDKEIIHQPDLMVPHPEIANRRFVLIPLNELIPNFIHPVLQQNIHQLLKNCKDTLDVKKN